MYTSVLNNSVSNIQARNRCGEFGDVILTLWSWRACSALSGYRLCKHVGFMAESAGCVSMTTMLNCCQLVASWLAGWLAGWQRNHSKVARPTFGQVHVRVRSEG